MVEIVRGKQEKVEVSDELEYSVTDLFGRHAAPQVSAFEYGKDAVLLGVAELTPFGTEDRYFIPLRPGEKSDHAYALLLVRLKGTQRLVVLAFSGGRCLKTGAELDETPDVDSGRRVTYVTVPEEEVELSQDDHRLLEDVSRMMLEAVR